MKLRGGYLPRIAGRPARTVRNADIPDELVIELRQGDITYSAAVGDGAKVSFGAPLAQAQVAGGTVALPAPAAGTVRVASGANAQTDVLRLRVANADVRAVGPASAPERTSGEVTRKALAAAGIWPLVWSSKTGSMPALDGSELPKQILVNFVLAEPFRARGKVVLNEAHERIVNGLRYLPRIMAEYGTIHLILTELGDPSAQTIRKETAGHAWIRIESVPVRYPVENPRVLCRALRRADKTLKPDDTIWVIDAQAAGAIGACLSEGLPMHERIVAVGGPGANDPAHVRVRIGTGLNRFLSTAELGEANLALRGGLMRGEPVERDASVTYGDDAFFMLPRPGEGEFMSFVRPGFDRASILPCFVSRLTGSPDRRLTASLRGERRPCIACGLCEKVCPMPLLPQVIHRYLYRDAIDEAERAGLMHCAGCNLCTFVCPSKIEMAHQFAEARETLRQERADAEAMETVRNRREETKRMEEEYSEDWRQ